MLVAIAHMNFKMQVKKMSKWKDVNLQSSSIQLLATKTGMLNHT